jgi:hypothetical protein
MARIKLRQFSVELIVCHPLVIVLRIAGFISIEKLIWSASSASVDPDSVDALIRELMDVVIKQLDADGFIGT